MRNECFFLFTKYFGVYLKRESETRNAKRLKRETPLRNGPKILDCFAGPTAGGHPKVRNLAKPEILDLNLF